MEQTNNIADYTEDQRTEIVDIANAKYMEMVGGGKYKEMLLKFGANNVSLTNILYILSQNPNATIVRNMSEWHKMNRNVKPEQKSLEVMSPTKEEETTEVKKNGEPKTRTYQKTTGFHPSYVFDISATEGEPFKSYKIDQNMTDRDKNNFIDGIYRALGTRRYKYKFVDAEKLPENANCNIDPDNKTIFVRKGMNNSATVLTLLDATARALAGNSKTRMSFNGLPDQEAANVEADSIDCILAARYGLDTSGYDFSCIDAWDDTRKCEFHDNLHVVCTSAKTVMDKVDYAFYRGQQASVGVDAVLAPRAAFQGFGQSRVAVAE